MKFRESDLYETKGSDYFTDQHFIAHKIKISQLNPLTVDFNKFTGELSISVDIYIKIHKKYLKSKNREIYLQEIEELKNNSHAVWFQIKHFNGKFGVKIGFSDLKREVSLYECDDEEGLFELLREFKIVK